MKKLFLLAMGFLLTLAACQQDESIVDPASQFSFTVEIPQTAARAVTDQFGTGTSVNRCILEIYHGDQLYNRIEKGVTQKTVTFDNLRLVSSQTYDFVFWADCATASGSTFTDKAYNTTSLKNITNQGNFVGNSDERDAFFAKKTLKVTGTFTENITLTRPFGLLIVKTNDLNEIKEEALKPTGYTVNFKGLPNTFNAFTGEVSGSADVTYTANELAKNDGTISMDFLWASENESALSDFTMTFLNGKNIICTNDAFTNIPIRRNYKTNVSGNLLTKQGNIEVTINPEFTGDINKEIVEVENITDVTTALQNGATNVVVKDLPTTNAEVIIPKIYEANNTNEISITLPVANQQVTVKCNDDNKNAPAKINLTIPTSNNVVIELPNSTVTLNGQTYDCVTATTAANTLIVGEETSIQKLTIKGGNLEVYGKVETLVSKPVGTIVALHVSTAERLQELANAIKNNTNIYNKVLFDTHIDFNGAPFTIVKATNIEFDGQGHKLSNFTVENTQMAGFVCDAISVTFRNLTIEKATVKANNDGNGNAYAGVFTGRSYGTMIFNNCQAVNSTVEGVNKVGGIIGFVAENHIEATNCKVLGCTIKNINIEEESGQIGGFAGYLGNLYKSNCSFTNCSVENSTIQAYMNREDRTISKFIGCFQGTQAEDIVTINNCSVQNVKIEGMNEMAQSFISIYGDLLGGQRYGKGTVNITNSDTAIYIASREQLATLATLVNNGNNFAKKTVKLANDIDLGNKEWTPIGKKDKTFQGTFDGYGYTISNLTITKEINNNASNANQGLFGYTTNAEVRNFTLHNASVQGGLEVGAVAGTPYTSKYSDITLTGIVKVKGYSYVGGMFGKNAYASSNNLTIRAEKGSFVEAQSGEYRTYVGGVIGFMGEGNFTISNVESNIDVIGSTCDVGGITGIAHYGNTFENCVCTGNVTLQHANDEGDHLEIGGIAGVWMNDNRGKVTFRNCRFNGTLKSSLKGVDKSEDVVENRITGRKYYPTSTNGELIIE